jgi:hypothetical protein
MSSFSVDIFRFNIFGRKEIGANTAIKMLVKLTSFESISEHSKSSFCANILVTKRYKSKMQVQQYCLFLKLLYEKGTYKMMIELTKEMLKKYKKMFNNHQSWFNPI